MLKKISKRKIINEDNILKMDDYIKDIIPKITSCKRGQLLTAEGIQKNIFTRAGLISISHVIQFIFCRAIDSQKRSITSTIFNLWLHLPGSPKMPTRQAFSKLLIYISFDSLRAVLLGYAYIAMDHHAKLFHGMKVYLVDGTKAKVPRNAVTLKKYGCQNTGSNAAHYPQMHILCLVELGTNFIKSFAFGALKSNERPLLFQALNYISAGSLIMGDCGFHSPGLAWKLQSLNFSYIIRVNEKNSYAMFKKLNFINGEIFIELKITAEMKKTYPEMDKAPEKIYVRIIKVKDSQGDRRAIYLMTGLMEIPKKDIADLYFERQRVEDAFKYKKSYGGLENIHPNTGEHMMNLAILGIIGYLNMIQLVLSKINQTPSPTEKGMKSLNRKTTWENLYDLLFKFFLTGVFDHKFYELIERSANIIRPGRIEPRCSKQPNNPHTRNRNAKIEDAKKRKMLAFSY